MVPIQHEAKAEENQTTQTQLEENECFLFVLLGGIRQEPVLPGNCLRWNDFDCWLRALGGSGGI
jgi:hypothetical protein